MKLTATTIEVLKNFATINPNIQIIPGKVQRTTSPQKNVIAEVVTQEEFPLECAIFDLSKFLAILTLFEDPELDFKESAVEVKSTKDSNTLQYFYAHSRTIVCPTRNPLEADRIIDSFELKSDTLSKLTKSAAIIGAPDTVIECDGKNRKLMVSKNPKVKSSNNYYVTEKVKGIESYSIRISNDNMKLIPNTYMVEICEKGGVQFVMFKTDTMTYVIPGEI